VNTKFVYSEALKDKTQTSVLGALESIRRMALKEGRPIKVLQTDNGKEFQNSTINRWMERHDIISQYCERDDKKCLGVAERFNRTIKLMIEKYLTRMDSNRWIDNLQDFVDNYNSSYHSSIKKIRERLEIFDEVDLIRDSIKHNLQMSESAIKKGDFVRLLNKRGKEGQRYTGKIYLVEDVGLNSVKS
jgi:molybdopterin converting factor small subunit